MNFEFYLKRRSLKNYFLSLPPRIRQLVLLSSKKYSTQEKLAEAVEEFERMLR